jgi:hypothetical protein
MPKSIAAPSIHAQASHSSSDSNSNAAFGQSRSGVNTSTKPLFAPRVERLLTLIAQIERRSPANEGVS